MKFLTNSTILITGGTGFIGSHLIEDLLKQKANIITTFQTINPKSYFYSKKLNKKVTMVQIDICDYEKIFNLITKYKIDFIFHLAAQSLVETAFYNPKLTLYTNILGTVNLLECVRLNPHKIGIIIASSDKAYGKLLKKQYTENDPLKGDHPYEVSKSSADLISYSYYKTYGIPLAIARFGNIYGEGDLNFSRIIPGIMKAVINNEVFEIRSDGKYIRDYLYVKDVISGYIMLAENIDKTGGEAFNFGSKETLSVIEVINIVEKSLNKKLLYKIVNTVKNEIPYQSLDFTKITNILRWKQKYSISKKVKKIYQWYRAEMDNSV